MLDSEAAEIIQEVIIQEVVEEVVPPRWGEHEISNRLLSRGIYLQSLGGRGLWPLKTTVMEQVTLRRVSESRLGRDGH
eukprot:4367745-Amphidinium_carterae.2